MEDGGRGTEGEKGIFHLQVHHPDSQEARGWILDKLLAQNSTEVFHMGIRDPRRAITCFLEWFSSSRELESETDSDRSLAP